MAAERLITESVKVNKLKVLRQRSSTDRMLLSGRVMGASIRKRKNDDVVEAANVTRTCFFVSSTVDMPPRN